MDQTQVRSLDRLDQLTVDSTRRVAGSGWVELPVGVRAARRSALDEQVAWALGEERPQRWQPTGPVDVDPQRSGSR